MYKIFENIEPILSIMYSFQEVCIFPLYAFHLCFTWYIYIFYVANVLMNTRLLFVWLTDLLISNALPINRAVRFSLESLVQLVFAS